MLIDDLIARSVYRKSISIPITSLHFTYMLTSWKWGYTRSPSHAKLRIEVINQSDKSRFPRRNFLLPR